MENTDKAKEIMDKDISKVQVNYIGFDGKEKTGIIEVHKLVSAEVKQIFDEIKENGFPIEKIEPIEKYNYSDEQSVRANNTSAYNFRFVGGTTKLSDHAIGLAIDINPYQNPWVHPSALNLTKYNESLKGTILKGSKIVEIFEKHGWTWGGHWRNPDYQHFFKGGELNKSIKNKLYDELGIDNPYLQQNQPTPLKGGRVGKFKDFMKSTYNKIIGESVRDLLVGPTEDEIWDNIKNLKPTDLLMKSCEIGLLSGVKLSLEQGANIHFQDDNPLRTSSESGHLDIVEFLLKKGAKIHANDDGSLVLASKNGHLDVVKFLLKNGAKIRKDGFPLITAAKYGHIDLVKFLLDKGVNIHSDEDLSLKWASWNGDYDMVKLLLDRGAIVRPVPDIPWKWMQGRGNSDIVKLLNKQLNKTNEGIKHLLTGPSKEEIFKHYETEDFNEILMTSSFDGNLSGVEFAIKNGADVNYGDDMSLEYACMIGNEDVVKYLLEHGADVTAGNYKCYDRGLRCSNSTNIIKLLSQYIDKNSKSWKYYIGSGNDD